MPITTLELVDYNDETREGTEDDGVVTIVFDPVATGVSWFVERIAVTCTSISPTEAKVYVGDVRDANFRDGTASGNRDIADEVQPILVPTGRFVTVQWTNVSAGAKATVSIQYSIVNAK